MSIQAISTGWEVPAGKLAGKRQPFVLSVASACHDFVDFFFQTGTRAQKESAWITPSLASAIHHAATCVTNPDSLKSNRALDVFNKAIELGHFLINSGSVQGIAVNPSEGLTVFVENVFSSEADEIIDNYYQWLDAQSSNKPFSFDMRNSSQIKQYQNKSFIVLTF